MADFGLIVGAIILIGILAVGREIYCWYTKTNIRIELMEKQNELLERILDELKKEK